MMLNTKSPMFCLDAGQVMTLDDAVGTRILARTGTIWVTEESGTKDHIVGPGDDLIVARAGRTVIQALQQATIWLAEGPQAANDPQ